MTGLADAGDPFPGSGILAGRACGARGETISREEHRARTAARLVNAAEGADTLVATMRQMGADAASRGLTAAPLEAEMSAHKAGRQTDGDKAFLDGLSGT